MNKNIATFPLTEAFRAGDECPFCNLERSAEQHAISFILGSAYMAGDNTPQTPLGAWIRKKTQSCYVCDHFNEIYGRYLDVFFDMLRNDSDFQELFRQSKGFCLPHFGDLMESAEKRLSDAQKKELYPQIFAMMQENMERVQKDVAWFVEKNDYRNKDKDWGESRDSIPRAMQKCAGGYPADPVFKLNP